MTTDNPSESGANRLNDSVINRQPSESGATARVTAKDAPIEMNCDEASAWAEGYNSALTITPDAVVEAAKALLDACDPEPTEREGIAFPSETTAHIAWRHRQSKREALRTALTQAKEGGGAESGPTPL